MKREYLLSRFSSLAVSVGCSWSCFVVLLSTVFLIFLFNSFSHFLFNNFLIFFKFSMQTLQCIFGADSKTTKKNYISCNNLKSEVEKNCDWIKKLTSTVKLNNNYFLVFKWKKRWQWSFLKKKLCFVVKKFNTKSQ